MSYAKKNQGIRDGLNTQIGTLKSQIQALEKVNKKLQADIKAFEPAKNKPVLDCSAKESAKYIKEYEKNYPEFKSVAKKLCLNFTK